MVTGKKGRKRQTIVVPELAPPQIPSPDPDARPKTAPETDHSGSPTREHLRTHQPQFMSTSDLDNCGRPQNVECSESLEKGLLINLVLCCTQTIRERAQKFRGVLFELFGVFWAFLGGGGRLFGTLQGSPCAHVW